MWRGRCRRDSPDTGSQPFFADNPHWPVVVRELPVHINLFPFAQPAPDGAAVDTAAIGDDAKLHSLHEE
jgi:hypothetical protein